MPAVPGRDSLNYPIRFHNMPTIKTRPNNPALVAAQLKGLETLKADLDAIPTKGTATPTQRTALRNDLLAVVDGSSKPPAARVQELASGLAGALATRSKPGLDTMELARHLKTVMNSAYAPPVDVHKAIQGGEGFLKSSGIDASGRQAVADALKAIAVQATAGGRPGMIQ